MVTKQDIETLEKKAVSLGVAAPFFDEIYFGFGEAWDSLPPTHKIEDERLLNQYGKIWYGVMNLEREDRLITKKSKNFNSTETPRPGFEPGSSP